MRVRVCVPRTLAEAIVVSGEQKNGGSSKEYNKAAADVGVQ